jgi:hypothetical protein
MSDNQQAQQQGSQQAQQQGGQQAQQQGGQQAQSSDRQERQGGQQDIISQVNNINPRVPNEIDLSRMAGYNDGAEEQHDEPTDQRVQGQRQQQQQEQQQTGEVDIQKLMETHPQLSQLAQKAQLADQLQQQFTQLKPIMPDIQRILEQRQQEARQRGDMTADFSRVFGDDYGPEVLKLFKSFVGNMMPQYLGQFDQRLSGVEGMNRGMAINATCDQWYEKLTTALKDDAKAAGLIKKVLNETGQRDPKFTADDLNAAIALEVSNTFINTGQETNGGQPPASQPGPSVPSTQAARQRMVPSQQEAQRRADGALESGQPQGGPQLGSEDQAQQEADMLLDSYRDW